MGKLGRFWVKKETSYTLRKQIHKPILVPESGFIIQVENLKKADKLLYTEACKFARKFNPFSISICSPIFNYEPVSIVSWGE